MNQEIFNLGIFLTLVSLVGYLILYLKRTKPKQLRKKVLELLLELLEVIEDE